MDLPRLPAGKWQVLGFRVHAAALFGLLEALWLWTACVMCFCKSQCPEGPLRFAYLVPSAHTPCLRGCLELSLVTGLWVTQCHYGHINGPSLGCGLASASPQRVDEPLTPMCPLPLIPHRLQPPPGSLKIPPGLTCRAPGGEGRLGLSGAVTIMETRHRQARGAGRERAGFSFPVLTAPVTERPDCTCIINRLKVKMSVCDAGVSNTNI